MNTRNVAILLFDDVELLDFAGPQEVFSTAGRNQRVVPRFHCRRKGRAGAVGQ